MDLAEVLEGKNAVGKSAPCDIRHVKLYLPEMDGSYASPYRAVSLRVP